MNRIPIEPSGITTTSAFKDGDFISLINLRKKNGALHPVSPRKIERSLSVSYEYVFIHHNNDYENWVGVRWNQGSDGTKSSRLFFDVRDLKPASLCQVSGHVTAIEQIGNTLSLITDDQILYLLFQDGKYRFLGTIPQVPLLEFAVTPKDKMAKVNIDFILEYPSTNWPDKQWTEQAMKGMFKKAIDVFINGDYGMYAQITTDPKYSPSIGGFGQHFFDSFQVRYALRLYDGTVIKHSPVVRIDPDAPLLLFDNEHIPETEVWPRGGVIVKGFKLQVGFDFASLIGWTDIIQSVDLFISAPLNFYNIEFYKSTLVPPYLLNYPEIDQSYGEEEDKQNGLFYLVKSFPIDEPARDLKTNPYIFPSNDTENKTLDFLKNKEVMPVDNFSQHTIGAKVSYTYNQRLHLANIKTTLFDGFSTKYFRRINYPGNADSDMIVEVSLKTGASIEKVYWQGTGPGHFYIGKFSYPDPRAFEFRFISPHPSPLLQPKPGYTWTETYKGKLLPHPSLNLAYEENPVSWSVLVDDKLIKPFDITAKGTLREESKIKVSSLSNPLYFPNENTYTVGDGQILAIATNAMNTSDQNYGENPLFVFTSKGIWTLSIGSGEIVYSYMSSLASVECPTSGIIGETPSGVVFTTSKGLMIISPHGVASISSSIEQEPEMIQVEFPAPAVNVILDTVSKSFMNTLSSISYLLYNPYESELIVCTKDAGYNYVFNFMSKSWYLSTEVISSPVYNCFPRLLVIHLRAVKDYSASESTRTQISFITRPLSFGAEDIKKIDRIKLRCMLFNLSDISTSPDKKSAIMLSRSNNGITFNMSRIIIRSPASYRDIDMGLMARSKFKRYILSLGAVVDDTSTINYIEAMLVKEYTNEKMR